MFASVAVSALILGAILAAHLWPYSDLVYTPNTEVPVVSDRSDPETGLPVVVIGEPITLDLGFCSIGVNTTSTRYMDLYSSPFGVAPADDDVPTLFYEVGIIGFNGEPVEPQPYNCSTIQTSFDLPVFERPGIYEFRVVSRYHPNPIRWVTETFTTEQFLLVDPEVPAP